MEARRVVPSVSPPYSTPIGCKQFQKSNRYYNSHSRSTVDGTRRGHHRSCFWPMRSHSLSVACLLCTACVSAARSTSLTPEAQISAGAALVSLKVSSRSATTQHPAVSSPHAQPVVARVRPTARLAPLRQRSPAPFMESREAEQSDGRRLSKSPGGTSCGIAGGAYRGTRAEDREGNACRSWTTND